jgi:hypothetical protein
LGSVGPRNETRQERGINMNKQESVEKALTKIKAWVEIEPNLEDLIKEIIEIVWEEAEHKQKFYSKFSKEEFNNIMDLSEKNE